MPIIDEAGWKKCQENNSDPYGGACVAVARRVMEILDAEPGDFDPYGIITRADEETDIGGITGFMAGAVANIVSHCHSRGAEFREKWNLQFDPKPREGVINPALVTISIPDDAS